jgi:hypothetical protein
MTGIMQGMVSAMGIPPGIMGGGLPQSLSAAIRDEHRLVINTGRMQGKKLLNDIMLEVHYRGDVEMTGEEADEPCN